MNTSDEATRQPEPEGTEPAEPSTEMSEDADVAGTVGDVDSGLDAGGEATESEDPMVAMTRQCDELQERFLRVNADYQNFVRRSGQNITDARDQLLMDVTRSLITILDHFDRALGTDAEAVTAKSVLEGVQIVRDELLKALERFGVRRIDVGRGDEFDPNRHEALMREQVEDLETNHVASQLQPGYTLGDKTVRPAQVTVAE